LSGIEWHKKCCYKGKEEKMKKIWTSIALLFVINTMTHAQEIKEGNIQVKKVDQPAVLANYNFSKEIVEKVLRDKLDNAALQNKSKQSGFTVYQGTSWNGVTASKMDVYTRVTGTKTQATVYVLFSKGYDNFINGTSDSDVYGKTKDFLGGLQKDISDYQLQLLREQKENELKKEQKKYDKMMKENEKRNKELQGQNQRLQQKQQELEQLSQSGIAQ
jgi:hypothetical protein